MTHLIVGLMFLATLLLFANPLMFYMPSQTEYVAAAVLAIIAALFVGLVFREHARDEREVALRARAARFGYLAGVVVLTLGIVYAVVHGRHADPSMLASLAAMIVVRLTARATSE